MKRTRSLAESSRTLGMLVLGAGPDSSPIAERLRCCAWPLQAPAGRAQNSEGQIHSHRFLKDCRLTPAACVLFHEHMSLRQLMFSRRCGRRMRRGRDSAAAFPL